MISLVLLLVSLVLLVAALLWLKLEVGVYAQKEGTDDQVNLFFAIPPLWRREVSIPVVEIVEKQGQLAARVLREMQNAADKESVTTFEQERKQLEILMDLVRQIRIGGFFRAKSKLDSAKNTKMRFLALGISLAPRLHYRVQKLELQSQLGLGDAASTGIGIGFFWSVVGSSFSIAHRIFPHLGFVERPILRIDPVFDRWYFRGRFRCIVSLRLGEIIVEGARSFWDWRL